ncbi:MAG: NFACT RNA binding domain-containing protein, partial [Deltaproteobacteria bacterium]|nr:NFACT RNA binding domain-containing protein [Deltaproteobacteria bacterium]
YARGEKHRLFFRPHRSAPLLFLTRSAPLPNPAFPSALVMRLRKYAEGRILGPPRRDWLTRQMAFALPGPEGDAGHWLLLHCKYGPAIVETLPESFDAKPEWPAARDIADLPPTAEDGADAPWTVYPVLTPALRRTLAALEPPEAAALLADLENGGGDLFWYGTDDAPRLVSAWPLPQEPGVRETATPPSPEEALPLLEALQLPLALAEAANAARLPEREQLKAARAKRKRLLANLEQEKERLETLLLLGDKARLIQSRLWELPPETRLETIALPVDPAMPEGESVSIALNPFISVAENMQLMFRKAAKATRGLAMLEKRMALAREPVSESFAAKPTPGGATPKQTKDEKRAFPPALIQEFLSSDGFLLWRGRSAEGNKKLLQLARPFDLWLHVEDGPSAHLLIRRDHAAQETPESTLIEAAALVGLKSWRRNDPKAAVMVALAKHVQPVKGGGPGTVHVRERLQTLLAVLDPMLEERLRRS